MIFQIFMSVCCFFILLIQVYLVYALSLHKRENGTSSFPTLSRPPAELLKPFGRKLKKTPKVNDDALAWKKERSIE